MSLGIALIVMLAMRVAAIAGNRALKARKHRKATLKGGLLAWTFPGLSVLLNLLRPAKADPNLTEEQQAVVDRRFTIDGKKEELEALLSRRDRLELFAGRSFAYRATHPGEWFSEYRMRNLDRMIEGRRADIRSDFEMLGLLQRKAELSGKERFVSVYMDRSCPEALSSSLKPRLVLPYDITREMAEEIKGVLARQYGLNPNDPESFIQGEHRAADRNGYRNGRTVLEFDAREHVLTPFGAELPDGASAGLARTLGLLDGLAREAGFDRAPGRIPGLMTLDPLGTEGVAINMNGVTLAYAVAGPDGKVRAMGSGVQPGDRDATRLASRLNEMLKGCPDIGSWIEKASHVVLSDANVASAVQSRERKMTAGRDLERRKALRQSILDAPRRSVRTQLGGLKVK